MRAKSGIKKKRGEENKKIADDKNMPRRSGSSKGAVNFFDYLQALDSEKIQSKLVHLWRSWEVVVGEELAAFAKPVGHEKKALWIACDDSTESQEIYMRQHEILENVNAFLGGNFFTKIFVDQKKGRPGLDVGSRWEALVAERKETYEQVPLSGKFLDRMDPNSPVAKAYAAYVKKKPN